MNKLCVRARWLAWIAIGGICIPVQVASAKSPPQAETVSLDIGDRERPVRDLALETGGLLTGQVLDSDSRPVANSQVLVHASGQTIAKTYTDANGVFAVAGLRGGVHQVATAENVQTCRLWAPGTAPPRAESQLRIITGQVVRGQFHRKGGMKEPFPHARALATNPFVIGGLVAAAIAIPIALNNSDDSPSS